MTAGPYKVLFFNGIPEFLDHRIGQNLARDSPNLALRLGLVQSSGEGQLEKLTLTHILQPVVTHLVERSLDGFALRIQDAPLQRNVYVSLHGDVSLYGNVQTTERSE